MIRPMENQKYNHTVHHNHPDAATNVNTAFVVGISLNFVFVVIEVTVGLFVNSLALLSDAGHNLADVVALALSLLAFRLMKVKSNDQYTYGYRKTSILVALLNAMFLLVSIGAIIYEAAHRLFRPYPTSGETIALVAGIGIIINGVTAFMFLRDKDKDINIKSAYLHLLNDAIVSSGIVAGGIIMFYTNWYWIDSVLSIIIAFVILFYTWKLLKESLRLSLDGVPEYLNLDDIISTAMSIKGVKDLHHIHIWAISTKENALTAHLVLQQETTSEEEQKIKKELKRLLELKKIHHITLETEKFNEPCETVPC